MVTSCSCVQPENAFCPISVKVSGKETDVISIFWNSMDFSPVTTSGCGLYGIVDGITTSFSLPSYAMIMHSSGDAVKDAYEKPVVLSVNTTP